MRRTSTLTVILLIFLTLCNHAVAPAQKAPRPAGKISPAEILEQHALAAGGLETLRVLQTFHAHGSFGVGDFSLSRFHSTGDFSFNYKAPASDVLQFDSISYGQSSKGHREGAPFFKIAGKGIGRVNGVTLVILEENWLSLLESEFDKKYKRIELVGLTDIDGRWAYALRFTPQLGDPQVRYYDCENFMMVRMDMVQRERVQKDGPESVYEVETYYSDYRNYGGINIPRKMRARASSSSYYRDLVLQSDEIRTNAPLKDSIFQTN